MTLPLAAVACQEPPPPCVAGATAQPLLPTHHDVTVLRVEVSGAPGARVTLTNGPDAEMLAQRYAAPPTPNVSPPAPPSEIHPVSRTGLMDALLGLASGALAGVSNLMLAPVTVPLNMLVGSDPFPVPWMRPQANVEPSAPLERFFEDAVLPAEVHAAALKELETRARQDVEQAAALRQDGCTVEAAGTCQLVQHARRGFTLDAVGDGPGCQRTQRPVAFQAADEEALDRGSLATERAWKERWPAGQRVVGAMAHDAFVRSAPGPLGPLDHATLVCRIVVTGKTSRLAQARVSLGFLRATGITLRATSPGADLEVMLPGVVALPDAHLRVAVVDVLPGHAPWGSAVTRPLLATQPFQETRAGLKVECRTWRPSEEERRNLLEQAQRSWDVAARPLKEAETAFSVPGMNRRAQRQVLLAAAVDDLVTLDAPGDAMARAPGVTAAWGGQVQAAFGKARGARLELVGGRVKAARVTCAEKCTVEVTFASKPVGMVMPQDVRVLSDSGAEVSVTSVEQDGNVARMLTGAADLHGAVVFPAQGPGGPLLARRVATP